MYLTTIQNVFIFVFEHNVDCRMLKEQFPSARITFHRETCKFEFANCFHRNPLELKGDQHAKPTKRKSTFCFASKYHIFGLSHKCSTWQCFHSFRRAVLPCIIVYAWLLTISYLISVQNYGCL